MKYIKKKITVRYLILIAIASTLIFNNGNKALVRRIFEQKKINEKIKIIKIQNELMKKQIYYLENVQSYMEKAIRNELNVIGKGEIEYRFQVK
ncbi:MAG: hypothetical protein LBH27_00740 [Endomicrobium sp.]|jgi:cell division protein FtsB|nr:hypothetical protein [Endomicrobium sp.]